DEKTVEITLKGAGLYPQASPRVKLGDIFSVAEIVVDGHRPTARPQPFAVLQAEGTPDKNGVVKCRFFHRHKFSFSAPTPGSLGFRCVKLGATKGSLLVRLVEHGAKMPKPLNGFPIFVQREGFEHEAVKPEETATKSDGFT